MFERPVLLYSDYCIHSKSLIETLLKHPEIFESFIRINIDVDPRTRQRPNAFYKIQQMLQTKIGEVPTIITVDSPPKILSDKGAFIWVNNIIKKNTKVELSPYNPLEMGSFSDKYSSIGSTDINDATEQQFKFVGGGYDDNIQTTDEKDSPLNSSDLEYNKKRQEREEFGNVQTRQGKMNFNQSIESNKVNQTDYNQLMNNRNMINLNQKPIQSKSQIDFTDPSFGLSGKLKTNQRKSDKEKDFDQRLEQLMNERS